MSTRLSKSELEILITGEGAPLRAVAYRVVREGNRDDARDVRSSCAARDADLFAVVATDGRELGTVERVGSRLVARIPGRWGVDPVKSVVEGARFCAANQPAPRPAWMR